MSYNIRAGRIEDLSAFVDFGNLENELDQLVLFIVFILVKSGKAAVVVLRAFEPCVSAVNFLGISSKRIISSHFFVHHTVQEQQHGRVINIRCILELLSVGDTSVGLDGCVDHELDCGVELLDIFASF